MNNGSRIRLFLIVVIVLGGIIGGSIIYILLQSGTQEVQLTIYTYDSLFWDPYYDLEGNFSEFSGIPKKQINIIRLDDANAIVARLLIEKDQPQADVAIGIDNALIHLIENKSDIFELYTPENISQIDTNLIQNLDPDKYLTPYDYGIISLYYQNNVINSSTNPELGNLTLDTLLTSEILSMLIVENPKFSSPGLGFLLWTIAVYGDPEINIDGLLTDNWRDWWRTAKNSDMTITKSWGDAFDIFFEPSEGKPIMVSYGTSPAYGYCQWEDDSTSAVVTYENDTANAWFQIEGIGLVKNAPHKDNAKLFIDWFLGKELQSNLPEHQWMYPANTQAILSECFIQSAISPDEVNRLNDLISPALLSEHMSQWQDEWELIMVLEA
jgi:thiamine transport system substrate-binding protein